MRDTPVAPHPYRADSRIEHPLACQVRQRRARQGLGAVDARARPSQRSGPPVFRPPYVGHFGWVGMRIDRDPDWDEVVRHAYRQVAPKRLVAELE